MRTLPLSLALLLAACGAPPVEDTVDPSCTIVDHGDGTATITCPDGTSWELGGGDADAQDTDQATQDTDASVDDDSCTVADNGDGTATITCPDGSSSVVGGSCTVTDNGDGTTTITCPDGTSSTFGQDESCTVTENADGSSTITCPDGTSSTIAAGQSCSVVDNLDGTSTVTCPDGSSSVVGTPGSGCGPVTVVYGDYVVTNNVDLAALRCVTEITGSLTINGTDAPGLYELASLTSVGGDLTISNNAVLTALSGLDALAYVGESLLVERNDALLSMTGLDALTSVGSLLRVDNNDALTSLSGLDALTSVRSLSVTLNPALCQSLVTALDARLTATCSTCTSNKSGC